MRSAYLPIHPQLPITHEGAMLHLAEGALRKPSYVKVDKVHIVHHELLESYDHLCPAGYHRLEPSSYELLHLALTARGLVSFEDVERDNTTLAAPSSTAPLPDVAVAENYCSSPQWSDQPQQVSEVQPLFAGHPETLPSTNTGRNASRLVPIVILVVVVSITFFASKSILEGSGKSVRAGLPTLAK